MALTDRHIKNIFIYVMPKFFTYGVHLIVLPILTRLLSPREFGVIALMWLFPSMAVSVLSCALPAAAQRYYFEYKNDNEKFAAFVFSLQIFLYATMVISSIGVYFSKDVISNLTLGESSFGFAIFVTFIAGYLGKINNFYFNLYQNMEKATTHSIFTVMQSFIIAVGGLILVWCFKMSYMGVLYGSLLGSGIVCLAMMVHFNRKLKCSFSAKILWDNMKYGLQVVPKAFTGFVTKFFDKYMLNNMLSLSIVGIYNIGQIVSNGIFFLMSKVWAAFQPVYYSEVFKKGNQACEYVGSLFTKFAYISLAPVLFVILFAQEIVYLLAPVSYHAAIDIIIVLSAAVSMQIFGMYCGVQYAYSKKAYWIFPITIVGTLVNVVANIILIPRIGLLGAVIASVIFYFFVNVLLALVGQRVYRIRYEWKSIIALYVVIILSTISVLYLKHIRFNSIGFYLVKMGFIVSFFYVGIKSGVMNKQSIMKVKGVLFSFLPKGKAA
ncbi:MAG: oligosaccharide flippase family protein [Candidatus Omnitrophica bacterium]|nr:oligosaccharide flippase family protein [Candidatus Omnitrophota bacterium]